MYYMVNKTTLHDVQNIMHTSAACRRLEEQGLITSPRTNHNTDMEGYNTTHLSNEIIGPVRPVPVFQGPV